MSKKLETKLVLPCHKKENWDKLHKEIKAVGKEGVRQLFVFISSELLTFLHSIAEVENVHNVLSCSLFQVYFLSDFVSSTML